MARYIVIHVERWERADGTHLASVFWMQGARPCWDAQHEAALKALNVPKWSAR